MALLGPVGGGVPLLLVGPVEYSGVGEKMSGGAGVCDVGS